MTVEWNSSRSLLHVDDVGNQQKWRAGWRPWTTALPAPGIGVSQALPREANPQSKH